MFVCLLTLAGVILYAIELPWLWSTRYSIDFYKTEYDLGFMILVRGILCVLAVINYYHFKRQNASSMEAGLEENSLVDARSLQLQNYIPYTIACFLGGLYGSSVNRISWYFIPYECAVFSSKSVSKKHWSYPVILILILIILIYSFYCFVIRGIPYLTPYRFFWET